MEENRFLLELKFNSALAINKIISLIFSKINFFLSVFSCDPLFSFIVTFCTLILLYLPHLFLKIVFSPVLILTGILLLIILRLGVIQRSENEGEENQGDSEVVANEENRGNREEKQGKPSDAVESDYTAQVHKWVTRYSEIEFISELGFKSRSRFNESFVEWNMKSPLEVIYEEYEGEEAEQDPSDKPKSGILRYPSLSRYYPESDSDSSSENGFPATGNSESPGNVCLMWDEADREGLIEIALDGCNKRAFEFHVDEENLIEIDISSTRHRR